MSPSAPHLGACWASEAEELEVMAGKGFATDSARMAGASRQCSRTLTWDRQGV